MSKKIIILTITTAAVLIVGAVIYIGQFSNKYNRANTPKEATRVNELNGVLVALGSSLTKATNLSSDKQGDNPDYSFSTGTKISSIYGFLKKRESNLTSANLASPGATIGDIRERQLPQALDYDPKYISIDPGADIVTRNSIKDFKKDLSEIVQKINPQTKIFLFTYPNFVKMRTASYQSCRENKVGVNLGNLTENNISAFNQVIKEIAVGKQNMILLDIYNLLGKEDVSDYDCLHINIKGQEKIAGGFIKILEQLGNLSQNTSPTVTKSESPQNTQPLWQSGGMAIGGKFADAEVVELGDGRYRMYYSAEPETAGFEGQVYSAISGDGINWTQENGTRMKWATFPSVLKLSDGRYRMYFQNAGVIKSAVSDDGLSWTDEPGVRIDQANNAGLVLANVAAPTVIKTGSEYIMVYRGTINEKYPAKVPNNDTQLFLWAVSKDGLSFEKKGIALDSRISTFSGLLDGAEFVKWDDGAVRLYFWSYRGVYHTVFENGKFSINTQFDYTTAQDSNIMFPENPPGDPTLMKVNNKWFMYYGQHAKGIYYAVFK